MIWGFACAVDELGIEEVEINSDMGGLFGVRISTMEAVALLLPRRSIAEVSSISEDNSRWHRHVRTID